MKNLAKCDKDLLALLQRTEKRNVTFLVDVLTDEGQGRLALSSSIKDLLLEEKHDVRETMYSDEALSHLLHEFQQFGGHTVMNFFRSDPLPYEELLTDVHTKLNGEDSKTKSLRLKEREIVLGLFGPGWSTLSDRERWDRASETKVIGGFFDLKNQISSLSVVGTAALFVAKRIHPAVAVISALGVANQSIAEAYRMTIPFVTQIAYIKMIS